jgi:hypothetical protein
MIRTALLFVRDLLHFVGLVCSTRASLAAENLFLRKQLAFYVERKARPRRLNNASRIALVVLARPVFLDQVGDLVSLPALEPAGLHVQHQLQRRGVDRGASLYHGPA